MMDVLEQALAWHEAGERVALATVLETWGSAPQPVGSQMAVTQSGRMAGSVSGGCIENAVAQAALATIGGQPPRRMRFGVSSQQAWAVGLACGGEIEIMIEALA